MRLKVLSVALLIFLVSIVTSWISWSSWIWTVAFGLLLLLGLYDVIQRQHAILRNFPIIGHFRYMLEGIRPEIQQYFVESDTNGKPISRIYRNNVYQKAKDELETVPFGSELDLYSKSYRWVNHSCFPVESQRSDVRITIGNSQCSKPYSAALLNISAMSFGALSNAAISALGRGAKAGGFYHNTGEGGLSDYHLETGADVVWQLGTAYFGARDEKGFFDPKRFSEKAVHTNVKMIEIKISQGAKPGHGGILPAEKVDAEIARIRGVPIGKTVVSPPAHTAFTSPEGLCEFVAQLRSLSGGKPVGFKLCLGRRDEFVKICEAIQKTRIFPDFITIDGGEGGTGAAPFDFINYVGSPLKEALYFVDQTLKKYEIRSETKVIASGKVMTGFDLFEKLALGADLCNSARGMMLSLGCVQSYRCNSNKCPTGVATSDPSLMKGLDVTDKSVRVASFQKKTVASLLDLVGAAGLKHPREVRLEHISCRLGGRILTLQEYYECIDTPSNKERRDENEVPEMAQV